MTQGIDYKEKLLFHFTHIDNLSSIVENGIFCDNKLESNSYINSGNLDIKARRKLMLVSNGLYVADFVPFYFAPRSPMLYTQWVNEVIEQEKIVYLVSRIKVFLENDSIYYFSDMNAAKDYATFYSCEEDLCKIYWEHMEGHMWKNTDTYPDRKDKRMAEFLVHSHVSWSNILGIVVFDEEAQNVAKAIVPEDTKIVIKRNWYF